MSLKKADQIIVQFMNAADQIITLSDADGRLAARRLTEMLARADRDLAFRLRAAQKRRGGPNASFTEASLIAYREQIQRVIEFAKNQLRGMTSDEAFRAASAGYSMTRELFSNLEKTFTGVVVPIQLREASLIELRGTLLQRHVASVDRYGDAMIRQMNRVLSQGIVQGKTQGQLVDDFVRMRGPQGLFTRYRSWAWRIVRTETAEAQNAAHIQAMTQFRDQFPDIRKKILATFDQRTAWDSVGVHGQVRKIDETFMDGAGRVYQRPPARPNDREIVIPWRPSWPNTEHSQPVTGEQLRQLRQLNTLERTRGRAMATVERREQTAQRRTSIALTRT